MNMQPVTSSNIVAIGHEGSIMHVKYKGGVVYEFQPVTVQEFNKLMASESKGKALAAWGIKGVRI